MKDLSHPFDLSDIGGLVDFSDAAVTDVSFCRVSSEVKWVMCRRMLINKVKAWKKGDVV